MTEIGRNLMGLIGTGQKMGTLRTKSGRLKAGIKKRRIKKGEPGSVILLDKTRAAKLTKKGRVRSKNAINVEYAVITEFMIDLDVRKLVEMVTIALAEHFRASLLAGVTADGKGPLPVLSKKSRDGTFGPRGGQFANKTGFMANNWGLLNIIGTSTKASRKVKPNGADGRSILINNWANRDVDPVDLQSVDGAAGKVIEQTLNQWMGLMRGTRVGTPKTARTGQGTLPQLR